ncbi:phosphorylase-domain-containing protein [Rhizopogon salebrosus TDB-379]|nr:phosphorylase-domain-containing protein [Rhizopogon salebrosus TDB-379]
MSTPMRPLRTVLLSKPRFFPAMLREDPGPPPFRCSSSFAFYFIPPPLHAAAGMSGHLANTIQDTCQRRMPKARGSGPDEKRRLQLSLIEDLLAQERDAGLGNGGLGRLAACYLDSSASQELPVWGYGLRCKYSIFQQLIPPDGQQLEAPDPWLEHSNPWELPCIDVTYEVRFHWYAERLNDGSSCAILEGDQEVLAVAYDMPIPGLNTCNTNNFRLWESNPKRGVDLNFPSPFLTREPPPPALSHPFQDLVHESLPACAELGQDATGRLRVNCVVVLQSM